MADEKAAREAKRTTKDYIAATWRQDSPVDGLAAYFAGKQIAPDPNFNVYEEKTWKGLTEGVPEQYHGSLAQATSLQHAEYIKSRLADKIADQTVLGDLSPTGRLALSLGVGIADPANLLLGIGVSSLTSMLRVGTAARAAAGGVAAADSLPAVRTAVQGVAEGAAKDASGATFAAGVTAGGLGGYAFERLRQGVNFEDSQTEALVAGLMAAAFTAPFAMLTTREARRVKQAAINDLQTLDAIKKYQETGTPPPQHVLNHALDIVGGPDLKEMMARVGELDAARKARAKPELDPVTKTPLPPVLDEAKAKTAMEAAFAKLEKRDPTIAAQLRRIADHDRHAAVEDAAKASEMDALWAQYDADKLAMDTKAAEDLKAFMAADDLEAKVNKVADEKQPVEASVPKEQAVQEMAASTPREQAPVVDTPAMAADAPKADYLPDEMIGQDVFWPAGKDGEVNTGTVLKVTDTGKLMVEDHRTGNLKVLDRSDLDRDHPLFREKDLDGFYAGGSIGSGQRASIDTDLTAMSKYRVDIYAKLNKSPNPEVRALADILVKDAIQKSDTYAQYYTASEIKKLYQRTIAGPAHAELTFAADDAVKKLGIGRLKREITGFNEKFDEAVGRLLRDDHTVLSEGQNALIVDELQRGVNAVRKVYADMLAELKAQGVKGADKVAPNDTYLNRVWDVDKMLTLMSRIDEKLGRGKGKSAVVDLLAEAMTRGGTKNKTPHDVAAQFLEAVQKLEYSRRGQDILMHAEDAHTLRYELERAGLSKGEVSAIVDTLFEARDVGTDKGRAPNLKFRFGIDERTSITLPDGTSIRVTDLLENNSRVLMDRYMDRMAGHAALGQKGITSRADFEARLKVADDNHQANIQGRESGRYADEKQLLTDMYDHITGRPMSMQTFNEWDRIGNTVRGFTRFAQLGQLGFVAALEIPSKVGTMTARALLQQVPTFSDIVRAVRSGRSLDKELAQDVMAFLGFGTEMYSSHLRTHKVTDYTYDKQLTRVENWSNRASHVTDVVSGNRYITAVSRNFASRVLIQKLVNFSGQSKALQEGWVKRLVAAGVDRDAIDPMLAALKEHAVTAKSPFGDRVEGIRWEDWAVNDPETFRNFRTAIDRETRTVIQDHDIGETPWFMHSTMGKYFGELKMFMAASYAKNFLAGLHYRDRIMVQQWLLSFATQSLGYTIQTGLNYGHNPAELDKRLTAEKIGKAGFARMAETGVASILWDTTMGNVDPRFQLSGNGLTANTDNRNMLITPSGSLIAKSLGGAQALFGTAVGGEVFTQKDAQNLMAPIPNMFIIRNIKDAVSSEFDKNEIRRTPN